MNNNEHETRPFCSKHNLPQEFLNPNKLNPNQLYACNICIIEYHKPIPIQQIKQSNQKVIKQFEQQLDQNRNIWNILIDSLILIKDRLKKQIEIIQIIIDTIRSQNQQSINEFKNINVERIEEINQAHSHYLKNQQINQKDIIQQIEILKLDRSIDNLIKGLNEINLQNLNQEDLRNNLEIQNQQNLDLIASQKQVEQFEVRLYNYELIRQSSIPAEKISYAIAFNNDETIVVVGCGQIIKIFEFKNKQILEVQSLQGHQNSVKCLQFMKSDNQFISGSQDFKIKIWQLNNKNQWINIQTLQEHRDQIMCLIINSNDDLIVSGSKDQSIIFWKLNGNQWQVDQQIQYSSKINSLSFNDSNTKLISCEEDKFIKVLEQQGKKWMISQTIQLNSMGLRLSFVSENQFVFLPFLSKDLHFYRFDSKSNKFVEEKKIQLSYICDNDCNGFPIKFIKQKNLLIVKKSQFINVLRKQEDQNFIKDQSIDFKQVRFYGDVSQDGGFMITWDENSKEYQVRELKEIQ